MYRGEISDVGAFVFIVPPSSDELARCGSGKAYAPFDPEQKASVRLISVFYIVLILLYIRFIYEDTNYDGLILYFLTLTVGRFLYFDFTVKSFLETMRGVLGKSTASCHHERLPGFVCWYGFHVGFLLKSNGVILSTFLAHLFMDCSIFLLHKTGILKHVIRKI